MPTVTVIQPTISEEQNHKLRCAAYCRVSSNSEDQIKFIYGSDKDTTRKLLQSLTENSLLTYMQMRE